jgi:mannosyltransferase OCH1-like enzyme
MKTIIQTSKKSPIQKNVNMLMKSFDGWEYKHFNDKECIEYIRNNKTSEFSNSEKVFLSFKTGQHKADFFRYFYLYTSGGLFIDSDLMIYKNIDSYILETNLQKKKMK